MAFFPSLKQNSIAYRFSSRPDCIFEIHQLWQSGFSRVYSNCCCSYSFKPEIIKIGLSSHKMYSNNILNCQESMRILNSCTKMSGSLLKAPRTWFGLVGFYGMSTIVGYLMSNSLYTYKIDIYDSVWLGLWHVNHCRLSNAKSSLYVYV